MSTVTDRIPPRWPDQLPALPELASFGLVVPTVSGRWVPHRNFDHGASASALRVVTEFADTFMAGSAGIHRGDGPNSLDATQWYEQAREVARRFLGAPADHAIVWTTNTTGAVNIVANALAQQVFLATRRQGQLRKARVVLFGFEHHANILPWRKWCDATELPIPGSHGELLAALDAELARQPADLVAITGASNVTGEMTDLRAIADIVGKYSSVLGRTLLLADVAQLAPHHPVDMQHLDLDIAVLSGHKLGAPYGVGVLACPRWLLEDVIPLIVGGGIVEFVYSDDIDWLDNPESLHEPGSPNVIGALTTAVAMAALKRTGMDRIADTEATLLDLAYRLLADPRHGVPGLEIHNMWGPDHPRIGVITFNLEGFPWGLVTAILGGLGYSTRGGCFCAHMLVAHLLGIPPDKAKTIGRRRAGVKLGAVRVSFGLDTTIRKLTDLDSTLREIVARGLDYWTERYEPCGEGHWRPIGDRRPRRLDFTTLTSW